MTNRFSKFKRKIAILTIVCMVFMLSMPINAAASASDISNHWAKDTIQSWMDKNLITGYPDGSFKLDNNISRAEFITLINKAFEYTTIAAIAYSDVKEGAWYADSVEKAEAAGYIEGYPDGTMKPDKSISREEAASIIMKIDKLKADIIATGAYTDAAQMSWSKGAIGAVAKAAIIKGYPDGSFGLQKMIKRGEATVFLDQAEKYVASMFNVLDLTAKTAGINGAIAALVIVPNKIAPTIQLIGTRSTTTTTIPTNQVMFPALNPALNAYVDPGTIAKDDLAGNITSRVVVTGPVVNTAVVGLYLQTYTITDAAGNTASVSRNIEVVARMNPLTIPQFTTQLLIPWAMPKSIDPSATPVANYYEIAMRQHNQQILPTLNAAGGETGLPTTTVWGYGSTSADPNAIFNAPSLTIEATSNVPTKIKWINGLVDGNGNYLPHLLPNDQTIEAWPNPATAGMMPTTKSSMNYVGPVPIITHVHGAHVNQESDGYPEAWYMPSTPSIPAGYATEGPFYATYKITAKSGNLWVAGAGNAVFDYRNDQRANTLWYHDHAMGFTRTNVYAGPTGFYLIRGGPDDVVITTTTGEIATTAPAILPGPAPLTATEFTAKAPTGKIYEIPLVLQDRTFNSDGSLFYPGSRTEFDRFTGPYSPTSDVAPIWNPEFFGDTIIVNGNTWPTTNVQPKRYRLRFLNGAQARTFILGLKNMTTGLTMPMTKIGSDGGFLNAPVSMREVTIMSGERADVIVDFTGLASTDVVQLTNIGPDGPYQGGTPDFAYAPKPALGFYKPSNPATTGKVMQFKVVASDGTPDLTTNPSALILPKVVQMKPSPIATTPTRLVSLNEVMSMVPANNPRTGLPILGSSIGTVQALLGTAVKNPTTGVVISSAVGFMAPITENIKLFDTEVWEIYNFTADAHPVHLHLVAFQVIDRQGFNPATGLVSTVAAITAPATESGYKDTVMALPGQVTRIKAKFDIAGRYVWHCHIFEHEENDMMRPMIVK